MGNSLTLPPDEDADVDFALTGPDDGRVQVTVAHLADVAVVEPCTLDQRFEVLGRRRLREEPAPLETGGNWLHTLPEGGIRDLFAHLSAHGTVTEEEAVRFLGSARALRRLSKDFEALAAKAPFNVEIRDVGGVKRYVREGGKG